MVPMLEPELVVVAALLDKASLAPTPPPAETEGAVVGSAEGRAEGG